MSRRVLPSVLFALLVLASTTVYADNALDATAAFERLSSLAGTWQGSPDTSELGESHEGEAEPTATVVHEIEVSANGSVVMETKNPGTDHEMINMYHLDGDELVMTHYCAGGNQPTMKLDRAASTAERYVFDFTGGSNLDPEVDGHIHNAELIFKGADKVESRWGSYNAGKPAGVMVFHLARSE